MLLLVAALMAASAASALGLVWLTYEGTVTREQESQAMETLTLASLLIRDRNDDQTDRRLEGITDQRVTLKQNLDMFLASLEAEQMQLARSGASSEEAKQTALAAADRASFRTGMNVFIFDKDFNGLANAEKSLVGKSWRDLKGSVEKGALEFACSIVDRDGFDTLLLWWPEGNSLVESKHLASLGYFPPWGWYVGVSVDYGRLETRAVLDKNHMVRDVLNSLARLRQGRPGGMFVMSDMGKSFLLLPSGALREVVEAHADQITRAVTSPETPARFDWKYQLGDSVAYVLLLPELGWRVGLIMDSSALSSAASTLATRQMMAIGAVLLAGLALAWIITNRISRPILDLTASVAHLDPMAGAGPAMLEQLRTLAKKHPGEAGMLASAWADTLQALDSGIAGLQRAALAREKASQELAASRDALASLNQDLESRVKVRTAALEAANDRLRSSEARYRNLFMHSPVAFLEADLSALAEFLRSPETTAIPDLTTLVAGKPDFMYDCLRLITVLDANPSALDIFSAPNVHELSANLQSVLLPESFPATINLFMGLTQGATSYAYESAFMTLDSRPRHALFSVRPMPGHEAGLERVLVSIQDLTEIKEGEARLRLAHQEAQTASKAKSEFLANMSHEIRTPLSAILGLAELSQRQNDPVKTATHLRMIAESAQTLLGIIGDVLDLSRVEAGKLGMEYKVFNLPGAVERAAQPFQAQCASKGIELRLELDPELPQTLEGDPIRLGQVLANLIGNAVKFTSQGRITVTADLFRQTANRCELHFCVKDSGIGISPELTGSIFESFRQADSSFSKPYQGVGLGLAICRELTTLMGGRIWVDSVPGAGSAFHFTAGFTLPGAVEAGSPETPPPPPPQPSDAPIHGLRVLVAEDNPVNRHVFTEFLSSLGHAVTTAEDGSQALEQLSQAMFDLVFMDVQMPRMDGLEAVRRLRRGECGEDRAGIPVVALTAYAMSGDRERFLQAGMSSYLPKPVSLNALQQTLVDFAPKDAPIPPQTQVSGQEARQGFEPLMAEFNAFLQERAATAMAHLEAGELDEAAKAGHDVKGTSMAFGVTEANLLGARLEQAARKGDRDAAMAAARELTELLAREAGDQEDGEDAAGSAAP
ncbi:MAG: response regulator [Acidobacteriota bacterium]